MTKIFEFETAEEARAFRETLKAKSISSELKVERFVLLKCQKKDEKKIVKLAINPKKVI